MAYLKLGRLGEAAGRLRSSCSAIPAMMAKQAQQEIERRMRTGGAENR
jgi:hypothetical protein